MRCARSPIAFLLRLVAFASDIEYLVNNAVVLENTSWTS
jgi:hypothetical protein